MCFTARGRTYGVNGAALTSGAKLIEPIRKKDAAIPGARTDMFPIIERGLKLCG